MSWASGGPNTPQRNRYNLPDLMRAMPVKESIKMEGSQTKWRWERGWRDLVRLGLLMRRMALDWILSRRQIVDLGALPQTWEQYSKEGRIWDLYIDRR